MSSSYLGSPYSPHAQSVRGFSRSCHGPRCHSESDYPTRGGMSHRCCGFLLPVASQHNQVDPEREWFLPRHQRPAKPSLAIEKTRAATSRTYAVHTLPFHSLNSASFRGTPCGGGKHRDLPHLARTISLSVHQASKYKYAAWLKRNLGVDELYI